MYAKLQLKSNIRVPPDLFKSDLKKAVSSAIEKEFVGHLGEEGLFIAVLGVNDIGNGTIISGDGAIYYETTFDMLIYRPVLQEVVDGIVSEVTEFGIFLRIGPIDGLIHVSQVMDDYVSYSTAGVLTGKESKRILKAKDIVRARIIAISLKSMKGAKLGLTMRQPGLGKIDWITAEKKKEEEAKEESKKEEKNPAKKAKAKKK